MEHDPDVMRVCVINYLEEVKRRQSMLNWSREALDDARRGMDALKAPTIGCEADVPGYRDKTFEAYSILVDKREEYADQIIQNFSFLRFASSICSKADPARYVCYRHWVDDLPWSDIAPEIGYSVGHIKTNIVPLGIKQIYELMPGEFRSQDFPDAQPCWQGSQKTRRD